MMYVGIDVSQGHLDFALLSSDGQHVESAQVGNDEKAIIKLVRSWEKQHGLDLRQSLFCLEPTGYCSYLPLCVLMGLNASVWLAHPTDIKQSMGMTRGKNDRIDALRIAQYAWRFRDKVRLYTADQLRMNKLKQLLMKRRQLIEAKRKLTVQLGTLTLKMHKDLRSSFNRMDKAQARVIDAAMKQLEGMIQAEVQADARTRRQYELITTVPGVGPVLATTLLAATDAFTRYATQRQLACHAGTAPFENSSGSSVRGRTRTSPQANGGLKSLLHMGAMVAVRTDHELRTYYTRKVAEGKPKMCVLNAVRGKILHRVCAVLRRDGPYVRTVVASV